MRRSDREITDLGEILSIINDCKVIHLAMVDDGEPYLLPLNFGYACESGAFSFFCHSAREGRKLDILRKIRPSPLKWTAAVRSTSTMSPASADTTSPPSPASAMSNFWTVKKSSSR